jgi:hypothetical protein
MIPVGPSVAAQLGEAARRDIAAEDAAVRWLCSSDHVREAPPELLRCNVSAVGWREHADGTRDCVVAATAEPPAGTAAGGEFVERYASGAVLAGRWRRRGGDGGGEDDARAPHHPTGKHRLSSTATVTAWRVTWPPDAGGGTAELRGEPRGDDPRRHRVMFYAPSGTRGWVRCSSRGKLAFGPSAKRLRCVFPAPEPLTAPDAAAAAADDFPRFVPPKFRQMMGGGSVV